ncbi:MAG: hypothetical protein V4463_23240 [Pseudomonadota bacterium]
MQIDPVRFIAAYETRFPPLSTPARAGMQQLLAFLVADAPVGDARWAAYILATVKHECADTWLPIEERGPDSYFAKYDAGTELGARLGNVETGDGLRFKGRGYVQLTGRTNYTRAGLAKAPERALDPATAYGLLSTGMRLGQFSGKGLGDYLNDGATDYLGARRIINGQDQAERIAGYAIDFEMLVRAAA